MAKPSDFFVGVVDFFAIFLPGALLAFVGLGMAQTLVFDSKPVLQAIPDPVARWVVFLFASYVIGHFIFLLGAWALDPLYDHKFVPWKRRNGDPLKGFVEYIKSKSFGEANGTTKIDDQSIIGTLAWATAMVRLRNPAAASEIDRVEADSKFFRSFTIALLIVGGYFLCTHFLFPTQWLPVLVSCLVLSTLSLLRFMDLRWKFTVKTYQHFIAWELDSQTTHSIGYHPPATETRTRRKVHMLSRLWTRRTAIFMLVLLLLPAATLSVVSVVFTLVKPWSFVTTIVVAAAGVATALIAYFGIPLSPKQEMRREMQRAINSYVILQSLKAEPSQKNRVMNRMRQLACDVRYSWEEIADYLHSLDVGERSAALASVQWQWKNPEVHEKMRFDYRKKPEELPGPSKNPDKGYFPQLLEMLCDSWDSFENYHATVAMWSMLDFLEPKQIQELCGRVIDKAGGQECPLYYKCDEWGKFIDDLKKHRPPSP